MATQQALITAINQLVQSQRELTEQVKRMADSNLALVEAMVNADDYDDDGLKVSAYMDGSPINGS